MIRVFDKQVLSNTPPDNTNVVWIYPIDDKHFDIRIYTIVLEDEYTSIKKWTSIGITDIDKTSLTTDYWYVGTTKEIPFLNIPIKEELTSDIEMLVGWVVEDCPVTTYNMFDNILKYLDLKDVYFDTRTLSPEDDFGEYIVLIPEHYRINSIYKNNFYEGTNSTSLDVLVQGNYKLLNVIEHNGKKYKMLQLSFMDELLPFQITTNVVRDLDINDYIVQETGNSIDKVMSQQAVSKILEDIKSTIDNLPKESLITQELGTDSTKVISQKVVTSELNSIKNSLLDKQDLLPAYGFSNKVDTVLRVNEKNELEWYPRNKVEVSNVLGFDDENIAVSLSLATSLYFTIPKIDRIYDTDDGFNIIDEEYPDNVIGSVVYIKSTNKFLYTYNRLDFYTLWSYSSIYMKDNYPKEILYVDRSGNFYIYTNGLMSLLKDALNLVDIQKIISQELGDSENLSVSLKVITDTFNTIDLKYVKYSGNPDGFTLTKDKNVMGIYPNVIMSTNYIKQEPNEEGFYNDFSIDPRSFCLGSSVGNDGFVILTANVFKDPTGEGKKLNYVESVCISKIIENGNYTHHDGLIIHNDKIEFFKDPRNVGDYQPTTVTGIADPTTEFDAVNKRYVDTKLPTKISQLQNDLNYSKNSNIVTINDLTSENDNLMYNESNSSAYIAIYTNERVVITNPIDLNAIYILPINTILGEKIVNHEIIFSTNDAVPEIGFVDDNLGIKWAKEPTFNPNKTYAVIIEGTNVNDEMKYFAMYAEFDTLNTEEV